MGKFNIRYADMISKKQTKNADPEEIKDRIRGKLKEMEGR